MNLSQFKIMLQNEVDAIKKDIIELSHYIHKNPELGYQEEKAAKRLADHLMACGFEIEEGVADLPTAFRARYGTGKPVVAFLAEYDALPKVGHGCGHNIIAATSVAAAVVSKKIADAFGATILLLGCPAEEMLGGKVIMAQKGVFSDVDFAMEIHPVTLGQNYKGGNLTANISVDVEFWGKSSHAAAEPWNGISALSALIQTFNNIDGMRLNMKDRSRIAGIIKDGGDVPNIIPDYAKGQFFIRAVKDIDLDPLCERVVQCFKAAALSTGCKMKHHWQPKCNAMRNNSVLMTAWGKNMALLGQEAGEMFDVAASTDVGTVSIICPTLHPFINISTQNLVIHSSDFADAAGSEESDRAIIYSAKALAMTAADIVMDSDLLERAKKELACGETEK